MIVVKNIPRLRFKDEDGKEFGEWIEKLLGDVSDSFEYGLNASSKEFDGFNKYIRITDIDEHNHKYLSQYPVSPDCELSPDYLVNENDILYTRTGASTGKSYLYKKNDGELYFAGFLIRGHVKEEYNSYFIYSQTLTEKYNKWVNVMSKRSGQPGINAKEYSQYKFYCPCLKEQNLIAEFLSKVDEMIDFHSNKLEALLRLKKGLMQKIFSREVRFKDEDGKEFGEWEEKKLGDISNISSGKSKNVLSSGLYSLYGSISEIGKTDNPEFTGTYILVARVGVNAGAVNLRSGTFGVSDNTLVIKNNKSLSTSCLYYYLKDYNLNKLVFGSGQPLITAGDMKKITIWIPSLKEQNKIAEFLSKFDELIDVEKEISERWKAVKKGLLQQMFV